MKTVCKQERKDEENLPFVNSACEKVLKVVKILLIAVVLMCFFMSFILPLFFGILPITMWKPHWVNSSIVFSVHWILQFLTVCYAFLEESINLLMFTNLILIVGYAKFLAFKIRLLVANKNFNGDENLVKCIEVHQKLKM